MANEISVTANLTLARGTNTSLQMSRSRTFSATQNVARKSDGIQNIPTTAAGTALVLNIGATGLVTPGWAHFTNQDATNFIEIGQQTGGTTFIPVVRLNALESCVFRMAQGVTYYARANTAAVDLEFNVLND